MTLLHRSSRLELGEFRCPPDDPRWHEENRADEGHLIVFPGTSVWIAQDGHEPIVTDPNGVVLYNRDQSFRRALVNPDGDRCVVLVVSPELLEDVARSGGSPLRDFERRPFPTDHAPCSGSAYLGHRLIVQGALRGVDPLSLDDDLIDLVTVVIESLAPRSAPEGGLRRVPGPATQRAHDRLVEDARALLASRLAETLSLEDLAHQLATSPYHLARIFRARTGRTLHDYRDQLRLRATLDRVAGGDEPLTTIGLDAGYASPSHYSDRFRRRFSMAPSAVRRLARSGEPRKLSRILKAGSAGAA
jgi:AraC-like DNA-binding protein